MQDLNDLFFFAAVVANGGFTPAGRGAAATEIQAQPLDGAARAAAMRKISPRA